jgi:REP element-mobilizing transposase RayT
LRAIVAVIFFGMFEYYLERLEEYRPRYRFHVYAYVLMSNHVHLLLETAHIPWASVKEIGHRLRRDRSIISRLYAADAADRDRNKELLMAKQLEQ